MKITQVKLGRISTPLRVPFKTALRTVSSVEDVIVELHTDTGAVGYGEAPPTGVITGDTTGAIIGAIRDHIAPAILGRDLDEFEDLTAAVQKALVHNTSAKAAVDMALWDLLGQKYSAPVYRMLGGARSNIVTDITISVNPPEEMARDARTAIQRGYDCLKVKVGIDPELDVARLAAVREAVGKDVKLRIDANQAWNAKQAVRILDQLRGLHDQATITELESEKVSNAQQESHNLRILLLKAQQDLNPAQQQVITLQQNLIAKQNELSEVKVKALEAQQNKDQADALQSELDRLKKEGSIIEDEHKQLQETLATVQAERDSLRQQLAEKDNRHWWEFWK